jgi:tetratricopeptide (TPR) repeat protein
MEAGTFASVLLMCFSLMLPGLVRGLKPRLIAAGGFFLLLCLYALPVGGNAIFSPEERAPLGATFVVLGASYEDLSHALIGAGPHTFADTWNQYRPAFVNETRFAQEAPAYAYSPILLIAIEYGLLGLAAFMLMPAALIARVATAKTITPLAKVFFWSASLLFAAMFAYPLPLPFMLLALLLAGCAEADIESSHRSLTLSRWLTAAAAVIALLLIYVALRQAFAGIEFSRGVAAATPTDAKTHFFAAEEYWPAQAYLIQAARTETTTALAETQQGALDAQELKRRADEADVLFGKAINADPKNPEAWIARAAFYGRLYTVGFQGSQALAMEALKQAVPLAPTRADIRFNEAALANLFGDKASAREYLQEAFQLRPEYPEAQTLLAQLSQ